ncbi:MAG: flagellin, partial [Lachnospiraceae bacterium]|nr:flagellin [Lachnospiraceae bacterium]
AEGALTEVHDMLQRINELSVKGENATQTSTDRSYIAMEIKQLMTEIDRVQSTTTFNEQNLLTGEFDGKQLQVGAEAGQHIGITITDMSWDALRDSTQGGAYGGKDDNFVDFDIANPFDTELKETDFADMNKLVKGMIKEVSRQRSELGAVQNRLEHTVNNLDNVIENTQSAEAAIRDTDIATEMVAYANNNILQQAGTSMLSQANQSNQLALSLLG